MEAVSPLASKFVTSLISFPLELRNVQACLQLPNDCSNNVLLFVLQLDEFEIYLEVILLANHDLSMVLESMLDSEKLRCKLFGFDQCRLSNARPCSCQFLWTSRAIY